MRPRPDAAENVGVQLILGSELGAASMRPRPDAAENAIAATVGVGLQAASMRPRPDAAENLSGRRSPFVVVSKLQ